MSLVTCAKAHVCTNSRKKICGHALPHVALPISHAYKTNADCTNHLYLCEYKGICFPVNTVIIEQERELMRRDTP